MIDFKLIPEQDRDQLRTFGFIFAGMIAGVFGVVLPFLFFDSYPVTPWIIAAVLVLWAAIHPDSLKPVYRGWMHFALVLGFINTHIIMFILFYGMFLPFGAVMRLFGWDAMHRKLSKNVESYRVPSQVRKKDHMSHPF